MSLSIRCEEKNRQSLALYLDGSLDNDTFMQFEEEVNRGLEKEVSMLVFDMQGLEYISSVGLRAILKARKALDKRKGSIAIVSMQPHVEKVLEIITDVAGIRIFDDQKALDRFLAC
jgi:anti-anti-sigma factor